MKTWECEIQPDSPDPGAYFSADDWRAQGRKFDAETSTGAKRVATRWAGVSRARWHDSSRPDRSEFYTTVRGMGVLMVRECGLERATG